MAQLSKEVRKFLEWSWNVSTAEALQDATTREAAHMVANGITPGKEATDEDLAQDWVENRAKDETGMPDAEWRPADEWGIAEEQLAKEVRSFEAFPEWVAYRFESAEEEVD